MRDEHVHVSLIQTQAPSYPTNLPVTVGDFKTHVRVTSSSEDPLIQSYLIAATANIETRLQRSLSLQKFSLFMEKWPCKPPFQILLPKSPIISVDNVKYTDNNGNVQTLVNGTDYQVDLNSIPGRIKPAFNTSWPPVRSEIYNAVEVDYTAGYGAETTPAVPDPILQAIRFLTAIFYQNRESTKLDETIIDQMIGPYVLLRF